MNSKSIERRIFAVIVENKPGVLARVIGMFSARAYNIISLTVSAVDEDSKKSRITIVTRGTPRTLLQIKNQLLRIIAMYQVVDFMEVDHIEKEIALVKVKVTGEGRRETLRLADVFKAKVVDATLETFIFMIEGDAKHVGQFITLQRQIGTIEVARSGVVAMACGPDIIHI